MFIFGYYKLTAFLLLCQTLNGMSNPTAIVGLEYLGLYGSHPPHLLATLLSRINSLKKKTRRNSVRKWLKSSDKLLEQILGGIPEGNPRRYSWCKSLKDFLEKILIGIPGGNSWRISGRNSWTDFWRKYIPEEISGENSRTNVLEKSPEKKRRKKEEFLVKILLGTPSVEFLEELQKIFLCGLPRTITWRNNLMIPGRLFPRLPS